ncbi:hypothetical protein ACIOWF_12535 [Cellulosimicrobium cellulans]|uniref:hypothetical protein n=1 Tax=Cellulosimicrobium cellulans TaxID=1710 RepID=UPI0038109782
MADFQGGRVVPSKLLAKTPSVFVPIGHLSSAQVSNFLRLLATSQSISQAYRPLIFCNSTQIGQIRTFGWTMEVHPTEDEWIGADAYGDWLQSVTKQASMALRRYSIERVLDVNPLDAYEKAIQALSGITGLDLRRLIARDSSLDRSANQVAGYRTWMGPSADKESRLVEVGGRLTRVVWKHRGGTGLVLAELAWDADRAELLADALGWSSVLVDGLNEISASSIAGLGHLSGPAGPGIIASIGLSEVHREQIGLLSGTPIVSLAPDALGTGADISAAALSLTKTSARRMFSEVNGVLA